MKRSGHPIAIKQVSSAVKSRVRLTLEPTIETIARVPAPRSSARLMQQLGEVIDRIPQPAVDGHHRIHKRELRGVKRPK